MDHFIENIPQGKEKKKKKIIVVVHECSTDQESGQIRNNREKKKIQHGEPSRVLDKDPN